MTEILTASAPTEAPPTQLDLTWVAGPRPEVSAEDVLCSIPTPQLHVVGWGWCRQVNSLLPSLRAQALESLLSHPPVVIVIGDGCEAPVGLEAVAKHRSAALLSSALPEDRLVRALATVVGRSGSGYQTLHGVLMQVQGVGLLLSGASGVGKSRLALDLLDRGHPLVADDAPRFSRTDRHTLVGRCPALLQGFVSVRGLGVLNVQALFGGDAVQRECPLQLIVHLAACDPSAPSVLDPLYPLEHRRILLGLPVPQVWLPLTPLCHAAVLVESLVRSHLLKAQGYDAAADFVARQRQQMGAESL